MKKKIRYGRILLVFLLLFTCCGASIIALTACFVQKPVEQSGDAGFSAAAGNRSEITYTALQKSRRDLHEGELILVNNDLPFQSEAQDIARIYDIKNSSYYVKDKNVLLRQTAAVQLNRLMEAFAAATGTSNVMIISGLRDFDRQKELYDNDLIKTGLTFSKLVAKPGYSEHHTGYAVDFGLYGEGREFDGTGVYRWLSENCHRYGFIVRYPHEKSELTHIDYEPWHFRYVGHPHAELIAGKGYCLEEYITYLRQFPYQGKHLQVTGTDRRPYEIYYVAADGAGTSVPVPSNRAYRISGNNLDGFIVTVTL